MGNLSYLPQGHFFYMYVSQWPILTLHISHGTNTQQAIVLYRAGCFARFKAIHRLILLPRPTFLWLTCPFGDRSGVFFNNSYRFLIKEDLFSINKKPVLVQQVSALFEAFSLLLFQHVYNRQYPTKTQYR
jgi:hypothetical protein